jgi:outer membrane receptor for ferrienterochelin and colicin
MTLPYLLRVSRQKSHNGKAGISDSSQIAKSVFFLLDFALAFCYPVISYGIEDRQIFEMPLEELLNLEVTTASKFPQKKMDAPSAVTVITSKDIKNFGYLTLADVIRSIRGTYTTYDRAYEYFGARGFSRSGDYNSRLLLMIDGRRVNDGIYDGASIGTDGLIDLEDVERIEFVPGSGSSIYGSNALFGVMNVITKQGRALQGATLAGGFGSFGMDREKASAGYRFENGVESILSVSRYRSDGHKSLYFPEIDAAGPSDGIAHYQDADKVDRYFGKINYKGFTLEGIYSDRTKNLPIAVYNSTFDANETYRDRNTFVEARYEDWITEYMSLTARIFYGAYDFDAVYPFGSTKNYDIERSQWAGAEVKNVMDIGSHKLVIGGEYQKNFNVILQNYNDVPYFNFLNTEVASSRYGIYIQDNISFWDYFTLNAGVRYDYYSVSGETINPRIALIYKPVDTLALKMLYGTAFRAPNLFEKYYNIANVQKAPAHLDPEKTQSFEVIAEYQPVDNLRLIGTAFHNTIKNLINLVNDPKDNLLVYTNFGEIDMDGFEFEGDYLWDSGVRLRGSYTFTYAMDDLQGSWLSNSPRHLGKLNLSMPVWRDKIRLGIEWQYVGDRKTKSDLRTADYHVTNLTMTADRLVPGLDVSASLYNFFDSRYDHPAGDETLINTAPQDGRNFRLWFTYHFQ